MTEKCQCQYCRGSLEFEREEFVESGSDSTRVFGQFISCPHCGKNTTVYLTKTAPYFFPREAEAEQNYDKAIFWGYMCAIIAPLIGFFIGIYLMAKKEHGHGVAAMALSIVAFLLWYIMLTIIIFS